MVKEVLADRQGREVRLGISSLGGDVNTALRIYAMIKEHGHVVADLQAGFNASAATLIAMGAARVRMSEQSLFLIHKCSAPQFVWQDMNEEQIGDLIGQLQRSQADQQQIDQLIANIYCERTGLAADDIITMMSRSAWHPAAECLEKGFVDEVYTDGAPVPSISEGVKNQLHYSGALPDAPDFTARWFGIPDAAQPPFTPTMNKKFITVQNLCKADGFENAAGKEGSVIVSNEQMQVIEDRLAELQGRVENLGNLEKQVADLQAERDRLQQQLDAQPAGHTHTDPGDPDGNHQAASDFFADNVVGTLASYA